MPSCWENRFLFFFGWALMFAGIIGPAVLLISPLPFWYLALSAGVVLEVAGYGIVFKHKLANAANPLKVLAKLEEIDVEE
jgi:disulfide bond formation protein DsbB